MARWHGVAVDVITKRWRSWGSCCRSGAQEFSARARGAHAMRIAYAIRMRMA
eukprot:SAG31_NODE_16669_length_700_cov_1.519135_2_plen_51_part_01